MRLLAPAAVMVALWWSSSRTPTPSSPNVVGAFVHNGAHLVAYFTLAAAVWLARWTGEQRVAPSAARWALWIAVGYGAIDEWHQSAVPGRVASVSDWMTDGCGALLAVACLRERLGGRPNRRRALPLLLLAGLGCVALATFGPW